MKESKNVQTMSKRRKTVSSTEAIEDILRFLEESDNEEEEITNDLDDLHRDNDDFIYDEEENQQNQEEGDIQEIPRYRKMLTPNRLVRSIETAQDISNCDPLILPSSHVMYKTTLRDTDDKTVSPISFSSKPPINSGRRSIYKWNLHGGKTTMLYLNLSGHNIFKTRFGTSPEKHCLTAMLYRLFSRKLAKLT